MKRAVQPGYGLAIRSGNTILHAADAMPAAKLLLFDCTADDVGVSRVSSQYFVIVWVSFVLGTPLKYTDPSGHVVCDEDGFCYDGGTLVSSPTPNLSDKGKEIRDLFHKFLKADGWWKSSGTFGLNEFVGMWILFESTSESATTWVSQATHIAKAVAQNLFVGGWHGPVGASTNALFNFMGSWKDVASGLGAGPEGLKDYDLMSGLKQSSVEKTAGELIGSFGKTARDQNSVVRNWLDGPSDWGNYNESVAVNNILADTGTGSAMNQAYAANGNWFVFSIRQYRYFDKEVGLTLVTQP